MNTEERDRQAAHQRRVSSAMQRWSALRKAWQLECDTPDKKLQLMTLDMHNRHLILGGCVDEYERWEAELCQE